MSRTDPARRWQVASAVTAVAGLGLGGILLQRPSVDAVEPIRLEVVDRPSARSPLTSVAPGLEEAVIVRPELSERMPTPPSPESPSSLDSPAEPTVTPWPSATPSRRATAPTTPTTAPTHRSADPVGPDSPASVDSPTSIDT